MKPSLLVLLLTILIVSCKENKQQDTTIENQKEVVVDNTNEKEEVLKIMKSYKDAIQNLTTDGTFELFTQDASIFEQGKVEGSYKNYIDGHLGPELGHFKSFTFSDYEISVNVSLPYAYATENYLYTIVLKTDEAKGRKERTIKSKGVATSILKKINGDWKIIHSHTSFKKLNQ
ncbi:nuclear transport factor 2 family protein [Pseudotenacibaculum sp. MALMAid0570]|uniref:YybH family protein n=1 Tax=Pseudotenacibaculum sp. MALMAid0570 TaxID=3143938 RepID=UPI0032DE9F13